MRTHHITRARCTCCTYRYGSPELLRRGFALAGCRDFWLKKPGGGKKIHKVFDAFPFRPMCISSPNFLKVSLINLIPLIRSFRELKMKNAPSVVYLQDLQYVEYHSIRKTHLSSNLQRDIVDCLPGELLSFGVFLSLFFRF